jgi:hypothetical protein
MPPSLVRGERKPGYTLSAVVARRANKFAVAADFMKVFIGSILFNI